MELLGIGETNVVLTEPPGEPLPIDPTELSRTAIGRRLAVTRMVIGPNQQDFARKAKIASNTYNQYEQGKKRPSLGNAIRLCDTYDLTLDWIYRGDPSGLRYDMAEAIRAVRAARN